jgi:hypothetical protein
MKACLLAVCIFSVAGFANAQTDSSNYYKSQQHHKLVAFDISLEPTAFLGLAGKSHGIEDFDHAFDQVTYKLASQDYGGMDLGLGATIKHQVYINFLTGISCNNNSLWVPLGVDTKINFTGKKVKPFVHISTGGIFGQSYSVAGGTFSFDDARNNGVFVSGGVGFYGEITKKWAVAFSPDYRFIYSQYQYKGPEVEDAQVFNITTAKQFYHQLALKLEFIFRR